MIPRSPRRSQAAGAVFAVMAAVVAGTASARAPKLHVTLKGHRFAPTQLQAPRGQPYVIEVRNLDATAA